MKEMKVVEVDDWVILPLKYGPNTAAVQAIIDRVSTLTQEQKEEFNNRWDAISASMADRDWWNAWGEVRDQDSDEWIEAYYKVPDLPAAQDAIAAVALKGMISKEAYERLIEVWQSVVGESLE
jgi:hypothetical protein